MKMIKLLLLGMLAISLAGCLPPDLNRISPDAGAEMIDFTGNDGANNTGPTAVANVTYSATNLGQFKTADGKTIPLVADNQADLPNDIYTALADELLSENFKQHTDSFFGSPSRVLNVEISSLTFHYNPPDDSSITATCVINLQAAAGTFGHMNKTYTEEETIPNSPKATQGAVIQAVNDVLDKCLTDMMDDYELKQFIS